MPTSHLSPQDAVTASVANPAAAMWDSRYQGKEYLFGTEPNSFLRQHGALWPAASRILCVADGEGRNSVWLAQQGLQVDAFDVSAVGVAKARQLAQAHGISVHYAIADCDSWNWPEASYDGIAAIFIQFADPAMRQRLFANMMRALKPGGTLLLHGYTPQQLAFASGGPKELSHLYTAELLAEAFTTMEIVALREYQQELNEGSRHQGRSALIDLIARKPAASV